MSPNSKLWLAALGAAVVGVLLGAGGMWAAQRPTIASLNDRAIQADAGTQSALQKIDELTAKLALANPSGTSGDTTPTGAATTEPSSTTTPAKKPPVKPAAAVKEFTFIKKVAKSGGTTVITADYAQMLTGDAAAAAATDHGDESPHPTTTTSSTTIRCSGSLR